MRRGGLWLFVSACLLTGAYFGASRLGLLDRLQARFFPRKLKLSSGDFPAGVVAPIGGAAIPLRPVRVGVEIASALSRLYPSQYQLDAAGRLFGSREALTRIRTGDDPAAIAASFGVAEARWRLLRAKYLLY